MRGRERFVRQATAIGTLKRRNEPLRIVRLASVESEHLLVKVGVEMEGARGDVRPFERPLQARPKVLDAVRMDATLDVLNRMVNEGVNVVEVDFPNAVRAKRVGKQERTRKHVRANLGQQGRRLVIRDDHRPGAALTFGTAHDHTEHRSLTLERAVLHPAESEFGRHGGVLATANVGFVRLDLAREGLGVTVLHGLADAVEHEPGRLLGDAQGAPEFMGRRTVLGVRQEPDRREPLGERDGAVLKDRPDLDGKLPLAIFAAPHFAGGDELYVRVPAPHPGAGYAVGPAQADGVFVGPIRVQKVGDGFEQGTGRFHAPNLTKRRANRVALFW